MEEQGVDVKTGLGDNFNKNYGRAWTYWSGSGGLLCARQ